MLWPFQGYHLQGYTRATSAHTFFIEDSLHDALCDLPRTPAVQRYHQLSLSYCPQQRLVFIGFYVKVALFMSFCVAYRPPVLVWGTVNDSRWKRCSV